MAKRIFSTVLLWLVILATMWFFQARGGIVLLLLVSTLTLREFYQMTGKMGHRPFARLGLLLGAAITLAPVLEPHCVLATPANLLAVAAIVFAVRIVGERNSDNRVESLGWTLFGLVYVPFMLQFLVRILLIDTPHANTGLALALWLIAVSKFCDVGALLSGMAFGKHKMAPVISPKKTWEGAIGGVCTSAALGAGIAYFFSEYFPAGFNPLLAAAVAAPIAVLGIVSDLVESVIKRRAGTKDSGATIPGIGGMFDLSDSLILTAPAGFLIFSLL
ncbi:MAG: phosphatidate cytidylyltransferase [Verrucomicrobiota bacterium]